MEDAADAVVPLRPGFDIQLRGFDRNQVIEHIELLEDQLKIVSIDRNEAVALNNDLRHLCDDTRHNLAQAEERLRSIEASDTGLPAASQRLQNMLGIAEEEVQTLRQQARRQAETIRGTAETEATALITEAEKTATELRTECAALTADIAERREQLQREYTQQIKDLHEQQQRMRKSIRDEYKRMIASAEQESDELLTKTRKQCGQWEAETEQHRIETLQDLHTRNTRLETQRTNTLSALGQVQDLINQTSAALHAGVGVHAHPGNGNGNGHGNGDSADDKHEVNVPDPREDTQRFTVALQQRANGDHQTADQSGFTPSPDASGRN